MIRAVQLANLTMGRLSKYDEVLQQENLEVVEVHYYHRLVQVVVRELIGTRMYSIKTDRRKGAGLSAILYTICSFNTKLKSRNWTVDHRNPGPTV